MERFDFGWVRLGAPMKSAKLDMEDPGVRRGIR